MAQRQMMQTVLLRELSEPLSLKQVLFGHFMQVF